MLVHSTQNKTNKGREREYVQQKGGAIPVAMETRKDKSNNLQEEIDLSKLDNIDHVDEPITVPLTHGNTKAIK